SNLGRISKDLTIDSAAVCVHNADNSPRTLSEMQRFTNLRGRVAISKGFAYNNFTQPRLKPAAGTNLDLPHSDAAKRNATQSNVDAVRMVAAWHSNDSDDL